MKTTDPFVVVILKSLGGRDITEYAFQLGNAWRIGRGKSNWCLARRRAERTRVLVIACRALVPSGTRRIGSTLSMATSVPACRHEADIGDTSLATRTPRSICLEAHSGQAAGCRSALYPLSDKLLQLPQVSVVYPTVLEMLDRAVEIFGHRSAFANRNSERICDFVN